MLLAGDSGKEIDLGKIVDEGELLNQEVLGKKPRKVGGITPVHEYPLPDNSQRGTEKPDYHDVHPARKDIKG